MIEGRDAAGRGGAGGWQGLNERPPHPATVVQPKAPHSATVVQPKAPHPATVVQPKAPHPATVVQPKAPHPATVVQPKAPHPAMVAQRMKKSIYTDPYEFMDEEDFGINPNYEEENAKRNDLLRNLASKIGHPKGGFILYKTLNGLTSQKLGIVDRGFIFENWLFLKGNTKAPSYAFCITVNDFRFYFMTSYLNDMLLEPLYPSLGKDGSYNKNKGSKFTDIFSELDLATQKNGYRLAVGKAISTVVAYGTVKWSVKNLAEDDNYGLSSQIAEVGAIFILDLLRAGEGKVEKVAKHQDILLLNDTIPFSDFTKKYEGMKVSTLKKL